MDYIRRDLAKGAVATMLGLENACTVSMIFEAIERIPAADVEEVRHAKWIIQEGYITCSSCFEQPYRDHRHIDFQKLYPRCPYCAATMRTKE